jgi:L-iditol 2-dehydrogenase
MPKTMKAAVLHAVDDLRIQDVPVPRLTEPDDVLVRIRSVGVCGSDIHYFREGRIGRYIVGQPMILGHECAGEVVEVGEAVVDLKPGDTVALEPGIPCRKCVFCRTGRYNLCRDVVFFATPPIDGAFCEYVTHPADFAFRLPEGMSLDEGAMMEPLAVGMYAAQRAGIATGDTVAILGSGPIGLMALQAARARGATTLIATDVSPMRLEMARKLGATHALDARDVDVVKAVRDLTGGRGADAVMEAAGTPPTIEQALRAAKSGGRGAHRREVHGHAPLPAARGTRRSRVRGREQGQVREGGRRGLNAARGGGCLPFGGKVLGCLTSCRRTLGSTRSSPSTSWSSWASGGS